MFAAEHPERACVLKVPAATKSADRAVGFGPHTVCRIGSSVPAHPSWEKLCLGIGLDGGERTVCTEDLSFFFHFKSWHKKRACHSCRQSQPQIPMLNSEPSSSPPTSAFPVTHSLLLWVVGLLITPGGEWAVGSTAVWKYCMEAIQTLGENGSPSGGGCSDKAFCFP